jgi:hypothetical protein
MKPTGVDMNRVRIFQNETGRPIPVFLFPHPVDPMKDQPYLHCWDWVRHSGRPDPCCTECHQAQLNGKADLTAQEVVRMTEVEIWLCCAHRHHWHALTEQQKFDLLVAATSDDDRPF